MEAIANFFGIDPSYFWDDEYAARLARELDAIADAREASAPSSSIKPQADIVGGAQALTLWDSHRFAERLNQLFDSSPYRKDVFQSAAEVANALQREGIPISADQIAGLRRGTAEKPSAVTVDALAFFFNVTREYFDYTFTESPQAEPRSPGQPGLPTHSQETYLSLEDFGACVAGLANSITNRLDQHQPDLRLVRQLSDVLEEAGEALENAGAAPVAVTNDLLERIITAWAAAGVAQENKYLTYLKIIRALK